MPTKEVREYPSQAYPWPGIDNTPSYGDIQRELLAVKLRAAYAKVHFPDMEEGTLDIVNRASVGEAWLAVANAAIDEILGGPHE